MASNGMNNSNSNHVIEIHDGDDYAKDGRPHEDLAIFELSSSATNNFDDATNIMGSDYLFHRSDVADFFATGRPVGNLKSSGIATSGAIGLVDKKKKSTKKTTPIRKDEKQTAPKSRVSSNKASETKASTSNQKGVSGKQAISINIKLAKQKAGKQASSSSAGQAKIEQNDGGTANAVHRRSLKTSQKAANRKPKQKSLPGPSPSTNREDNVRPPNKEPKTAKRQLTQEKSPVPHASGTGNDSVQLAKAARNTARRKPKQKKASAPDASGTDNDSVQLAKAARKAARRKPKQKKALAPRASGTDNDSVQLMKTSSKAARRKPKQKKASAPRTSGTDNDSVQLMKTSSKAARRKPKQKKGPLPARSNHIDTVRAGSLSHYPIMFEEDDGIDDVPIIGVDICPEIVQRGKSVDEHYPGEDLCDSENIAYGHIFNSLSSRTEIPTSNRNPQQGVQTATTADPPPVPIVPPIPGTKVICSSFSQPVSESDPAQRLAGVRTPAKKKPNKYFSSSKSKAASSRDDILAEAQKRESKTKQKAELIVAANCTPFSQSLSKRKGDRHPSSLVALKRRGTKQRQTSLKQNADDRPFVGLDVCPDMEALTKPSQWKETDSTNSAFHRDTGTINDLPSDSGKKAGPLQSIGATDATLVANREENVLHEGPSLIVPPMRKIPPTLQQVAPSFQYQELYDALKDGKQRYQQDIIPCNEHQQGGLKSGQNRGSQSEQQKNKRLPQLQQGHHRKRVRSIADSDGHETRPFASELDKYVARRHRTLRFDMSEPSWRQSDGISVSNEVRASHFQFSHHSFLYLHLDSGQSQGPNAQQHDWKFPSYSYVESEFIETCDDEETRSSWLAVLQQLDSLSSSQWRSRERTLGLQRHLFDTREKGNARVLSHLVGNQEILHVQQSTGQNRANTNCENETQMKEHHKKEQIPSRKEPSDRKSIESTPHLRVENGASQSLVKAHPKIAFDAEYHFHLMRVKDIEQVQVKGEKEEYNRIEVEGNTEPVFSTPEKTAPENTESLVDSHVGQETLKARLKTVYQADQDYVRAIQVKGGEEASGNLRSCHRTAKGIAERVNRIQKKEELGETSGPQNQGVVGDAKNLNLLMSELEFPARFQKRQGQQIKVEMPAASGNQEKITAAGACQRFRATSIAIANQTPELNVLLMNPQPNTKQTSLRVDGVLFEEEESREKQFQMKVPCEGNLTVESEKEKFGAHIKRITITSEEEKCAHSGETDRALMHGAETVEGNVYDDVPLISLKRTKRSIKVPSHGPVESSRKDPHNGINGEVELGRRKQPTIQTKKFDRRNRTADNHKSNAIEPLSAPGGCQLLSRNSKSMDKYGLTRKNAKKSELGYPRETNRMRDDEDDEDDEDDDVLLISLKRKGTAAAQVFPRAKKRGRTNQLILNIAKSTSVQFHSDESEGLSTPVLSTKHSGEKTSYSEQGDEEVVVTTSTFRKRKAVEVYQEALPGESITLALKKKLRLDAEERLETGTEKPEIMTRHRRTDGSCRDTPIDRGQIPGSLTTLLPLPKAPQSAKQNDKHGEEQNLLHSWEEQSVPTCVNLVTRLSKVKPTDAIADIARCDETKEVESYRSKEFEKAHMLTEPIVPNSLNKDDSPGKEEQSSSPNDFPFGDVSCKVSTHSPEIQVKEAKINSFLEHTYGFVGLNPPDREFGPDNVMKIIVGHVENPSSLIKGANDTPGVTAKIESVETVKPTTTTSCRFRPQKKSIGNALDVELVTSPNGYAVSGEKGVHTKKQEEAEGLTQKDEARRQSNTAVRSCGETRFVFHASYPKNARAKSKSRPTTTTASEQGKVSWVFQSQQDAEAEQERLIRASADRVRTRTKVHVTSQTDAEGPGLYARTFVTPIVDVHRHLPDHWQYVDLYARLGLPRHATDSMIKTHYRRLALVYHPDRNTSSNVETKHKFQAVTEAYHTLMTKLQIS